MTSLPTGGFNDPAVDFNDPGVAFGAGGAPGGSGRRGLFMGITGPYGGYSTAMQTIENNADVEWFRCGYPEIQNMLSSPNNPANAGTFNTAALAAQVAAVHADGRGFIFSGLGVPQQVNPLAGTGGNYKYFPTTDAGRAQMGTYQAAVAHVLMDSHRATGKPVIIEWYQEANIVATNPGFQATPAIIAAAFKAFVKAVRAAEPLLPIMMGSLANRGDSHNALDISNRITSELYLQDIITNPTTGIDSAVAAIDLRTAFDWVGHHPYTGDADPRDHSAGWAIGQLDAFIYVMRSLDMRKPDGSLQQISATEYGKERVRTKKVTGQAGRVLTLQSGALVNFDDGCPIASSILPGGTTILSHSGATVTVSADPTGTFTSTTTVDITDNARQQDHLTGYFEQFDAYRVAGVLGGPELYYEDPSDSKSFVHATTPWATWPAGDTFHFFAEIDPSPVAAFIWAPSTIHVGDVVAFTDATGNTPTAWLWNFGDGATSPVKNPTHAWSTPGVKTVQLRATNFYGSSTVTHTITVLAVVIVPITPDLVEPYPVPKGRGRWRLTLHSRDFGSPGTLPGTPVPIQLWDRTVIGELSNATGRKLEQKLNDSATLTFTVNGRDLQGGYIKELAHEVIAWRWDGWAGPAGRDVCMFRGVITAAEDDLDGTQHTVTFTAQDYLAVMARRIVTPAAGITYPAGGGIPSDQFFDAITARMVEDASHQIPLAGPGLFHVSALLPLWATAVDPSGAPRPTLFGSFYNRTYAGGSVMLENLKKFASEAGFDIDVVPNAQVRGLRPEGNDALRVWYPRQGVARTDMAFVYGGNVAAVKRTVASSDYVNYARAIGNKGSADPSAAQVAADAYDQSHTEYGVWSTSDTGSSDVAASLTVQQQVNAVIAQQGQLIASLDLTMRPDAYRFGFPNMGDTCTCHVVSGRLNVNDPFRVVAFTYDIGDDGQEDVKVTVGRPTPSFFAQITSLDGRISANARR